VLVDSEDRVVASTTRLLDPTPGTGLSLMCNDYGNKIPYSEFLAAFSEIRIPVKWPDSAPNLERRDDIWPTDRAPVIRRLEDGRMSSRNCGGVFRLLGQKGPPVINFRDEGRRFPVGRCLVPASHFFEFTGKKSPKKEVEIHEGRRGLVLLRRSMASHGGGR
jgi:putative SOS response-associated peptidase YedK